MYADDSIDYGMDHDDEEEDADAQHDSQETDQSQQTPSTQAASQPSQPDPAVDSHLWGYLQPCSAALTRIDFWRIHPRYTIGRSTEINQVVLPGFKVSSRHAIMTWDGKDSDLSVIVQDLSSNGTFINHEKIGKNRTRIVRDGNEIAFGTPTPQPNNPLEDYRFVYRHVASGIPKTGLYASYDLGVELGQGSFASVKRAMHRASGVWYAVKMIHAGKTVRHNGEPRQDLFAREISIMERLEHPNVCKLVEVFFHDDNSINLVLELIEGGDLLEYILNSNEGLTEMDARDITYQMCDALSYIHAQGITHRDMKPENVLLTKQRPPVIKVADFGLAKVVDSLTMLRTMCGTPSYLAPEVVMENKEGYDNLVDSWSVGVILFSMVTNQGPFIEDTSLDIRRRILTRTVEWRALDEHDRQFSLELRHFTRQFLVVDPRRRMSITNALHHDWLRHHFPYHGTSADNMAMAMSMEREGPPPQQAGGRTLRSQRLQRRHEVEREQEELPEEMIAYAAARDGPGAGAKGHKRVRAELTPVQDVEALADSAKPRRSGRQSKAARRD